MGVVDLPRLERSDRIVDAVYVMLRDAIFAGTMPPGSKLSVPELSKRLGVSRSPVREAVVRLCQEGLADEEPRRGAAVARVHSHVLAGLYEVRATLEGLAARLAVEHATPNFLPELEALFADHEQAVRRGDLEGHREADIAFHRRIREEALNPELKNFLDSIQTRVRLAMLTTTVTSGPHLALTDHRAILAAIRAGDAAVAERAASAHVARLRQRLLDPFGSETRASQ